MPISLICLACGKRIKVESPRPGARAKCPCGHVQAIPDRTAGRPGGNPSAGDGKPGEPSGVEWDGQVPPKSQDEPPGGTPPHPDRIVFNCPHCSTEVNAPKEWAGAQAMCPHCRKMVTVSGVASAANPKPSPDIKTRFKVANVRAGNWIQKWVARPLGIVIVLIILAKVLSQAQSLWEGTNRDKFEQLVIGKTPEEVIRNVGRPSETTGYERGVDTWYYHEVTVDSVSNKTDPVTIIGFRNGAAFRVLYR